MTLNWHFFAQYGTFMVSQCRLSKRAHAWVLPRQPCASAAWSSRTVNLALQRRAVQPSIGQLDGKQNPPGWIKTAPSWTLKATQLQSAEPQRAAEGRMLPIGTAGCTNAFHSALRTTLFAVPPTPPPRFSSGMKTEEQHVSLRPSPLPSHKQQAGRWRWVTSGNHRGGFW